MSLTKNALIVPNGEASVDDTTWVQIAPETKNNREYVFIQNNGDGTLLLALDVDSKTNTEKCIRIGAGGYFEPSQVIFKNEMWVKFDTTFTGSVFHAIDNKIG